MNREAQTKSLSPYTIMNSNQRKAGSQPDIGGNHQTPQYQQLQQPLQSTESAAVDKRRLNFVHKPHHLTHQHHPWLQKSSHSTCSSAVDKGLPNSVLNQAGRKHISAQHHQWLQQTRQCNASTGAEKGRLTSVQQSDSSSLYHGARNSQATVVDNGGFSFLQDDSTRLSNCPRNPEGPRADIGRLTSFLLADSSGLTPWGRNPEDSGASSGSTMKFESGSFFNKQVFDYMKGRQDP